MFEALDITEADVAGLNEAAAIDLGLARHFAAKAQAAEDPDVAAKFARTAGRATRSYRQDLLLKVRLKRDLQRAQAEAPEPDPADEPRRPPVSPLRFNKLGDRAVALIDAAKKVAWAEYEALDGLDSEPEYFLSDYAGDLESWVALAAIKPGFTERPLDEHVADLCRELSLDPELSARWRDLADPPEAVFDPPPPKPKPPPTPIETDDRGGYWFKPAGWKVGDRLSYCRGEPRPP